MPHPDFHIVQRQALGNSRINLPSEFQQDIGPFPVGVGLQPRQFHLPTESQALRRHGAAHFAVAGHHGVARFDARVLDHDVVAAFGFQRHVVAGLPRQDFRPRAGGDHRTIAGDFVALGGDGA